MEQIGRITSGLRKLVGKPVAVAAPAASAPAPAHPAAREIRVIDDTNTVRVDGRDYKLFFLCGHPRSGTNWVCSLLNLHPAINCEGEFRFEALRHGFDTLERRWWHVAKDESVRPVAERCLRDTVRQVMGAVAPRKPGASWIGDRTPRGLVPLLPDAPHFLVVRDGRDVLVSLSIKDIVNGGYNFQREPFKTELAGVRHAILHDPDWFRKNPDQLFANEAWVRMLARRWSGHVSADLETVRRVERGELPLKLLTLRYERLHADPAGQRDAMYRFLGLDPSGAAPISADSKTAPGFGREDTSSFWRKGEVGDWRHYATDNFRRWFKEEAGATLVELGYEKDSNW